MSQLEEKVVEIISQLQGLAEPAAQVSLDAVRYGAAIDIATAIIELALAYGLYRLCVKLGLLARDSETDAELPLMLGTTFSGICCVVMAVAATLVLLSTSTWLAIFSPEMALARQILRSLTAN